MTGESGELFEIDWASPAKQALRRLPEKVTTAVSSSSTARRVEVLAIGHRADVYRRD